LFVALTSLRAPAAWGNVVSVSANRASFDERHDVVQQALCVSRVQNRKDVRVVELAQDLDLTGEAVGAERGCQVGIEDLHRDLPPVPHVLADEHGGHSALADLTLDLVAIWQRFAELFEQPRHVGRQRREGKC
jgi:hypothetical protein